LRKRLTQKPRPVSQENFAQPNRDFGWENMGKTFLWVYFSMGEHLNDDILKLQTKLSGKIRAIKKKKGEHAVL